MYRETSWAGNVWERQLLSWQTLKIKQGSHGGHGEHREKTEENSRGRLSVGLSLWEGPRNAWERQLLSWQTLKMKQGSHGGHGEHREKTEENSWDRLQVDLSLWEGPRNAWERLGTPTFKLACSKESSHGDHEGHKEERYLGELTPGLCFLCALCVLCAKHLCFFEKTCRTKVRRSQPALPQNLLSCYNNHIFLRSFLN